MTKKEKKEPEKSKEATVGEALIEIMKKGFAKLTEQNEVIISLLSGTATLRGGDKTNPYELIEKLFPDDIRNKLELSIAGDKWVAKPRQWLGKETFRITANLVKELGGEYISAGKNSHFEGPLPK